MLVRGQSGTGGPPSSSVPVSPSVDNCQRRELIINVVDVLDVDDVPPWRVVVLRPAPAPRRLPRFDLAGRGRAYRQSADDGPALPGPAVTRTRGDEQSARAERSCMWWFEVLTEFRFVASYGK